MKKIIALVLALVMALSMGSVALADTGDTVYIDNGVAVVVDSELVQNGDGIWANIDLDVPNIEVEAGIGIEGENTIEKIIIAPGSKLHVDVVGLVTAQMDNENEEAKDEAEALLKNFKLEYEVTKGSALVKNIEYAKGKLTIELMENYTLSDVKDLQFTVTLTAKKDFSGGASNSENVVNKGDTIKLIVDGQGISIDSDIAVNYTPRPLTEVTLGVANALVMVEGEEDADDAIVKDITGFARNNIIYKVEEDEAGYVKFGNSDSLFQIVAKMNSEEKLFMHLIEDDADLVKALEEANEGADVHTYTLEGRVAFRNPADFTLQADYADQYKIYAYDGGKLTEVKTEWDSIEGVYKWSAKEMTTYVIADQELVAADEVEETKNPDTGANDVLGVAAALAVVSLVAAGAVSLKK